MQARRRRPHEARGAHCACSTGRSAAQQICSDRSLADRRRSIFRCGRSLRRSRSAEMPREEPPHAAKIPAENQRRRRPRRNLISATQQFSQRQRFSRTLLGDIHSNRSLRRQRSLSCLPATAMILASVFFPMLENHTPETASTSFLRGARHLDQRPISAPDETHAPRRQLSPFDVRTPGAVLTQMGRRRARR